MKDRTRFEMRITVLDRQKLLEAARQAGLPLSAWVKNTLLKAAEREARRAKAQQAYTNTPCEVVPS